MKSAEGRRRCGDLVSKCCRLTSEAFFFKKRFSEVWEVWMCHRVGVCACVFSFHKRGQVRSIGPVTEVCECTRGAWCGGGYVLHLHLRTCLHMGNGALKRVCGQSPLEQMLATACSCSSSSRRLQDLAAARIKVMIHLRRKCQPHPSTTGHCSTADMYLQYTSCIILSKFMGCRVHTLQPHD